MSNDTSLDQKLLSAILAVLVDEREQRLADGANLVKSEILLADAGLSASEISSVIGKQPAAVRMTLSRARRATRKKGGTDG